MLTTECQKTSECVRRLKEGDRSAFDALVEAHKRKAFSLVFHIVGNVEDAKDIVQEAFVRVYTGIKNFKGEAKFSTWFYRILINLARDCIRKRIRARKVFSEDRPRDAGPEDEERQREVPDERLNPRRLVLAGELGDMIEKATGELSGHQRLAFCMRYLDAESIETISEILKCRPSTVKVHLFRATQALRQKLEFYLKK